MRDLDPQDPDFSTFDDVGLATEAKREMLRERRQARAIQRASAELDLKQQAISLGILVAAACGAAAAIAAWLGGAGAVA